MFLTNKNNPNYIYNEANILENTNLEYIMSLMIHFLNDCLDCFKTIWVDVSEEFHQNMKEKAAGISWWEITASYFT